jgi:ubiquinone/menaquinone biosynthesis C-methylase UbiE
MSDAAKLYHDYIVTDQRHYEATTKFSGLPRAERILDVGGNDGSFALMLRTNLNDVQIVDVSEKALQIARERGILSHRVDLNNEAFPFPDNYFDRVFCIETLEHLNDPEHCLGEINRVLEIGGMLVLTTPNNRAKRMDRYHIQAWSHTDLGPYIEKFGFKVVKEAGCGVPGTRVLGIPVSLDIGLGALIPRIARRWMVKASKVPVVE